MSSASWLAFLDSDDVWKPNKLARHAELHALTPQLDYSFSNFQILHEGVWQHTTKFDDAPAGFFAGGETIAEGFHVHTEGFYDRLLAFQPVFPSCFLITRARFDRIGRWNDRLGRILSEDLEFTLRCVGGGAVGIIDDPLVGIRKHAGNISGQNLRVLCGEIDILRFCRDHHRLSEHTRTAITQEIERRRLAAIDLAFSVHDFDLVRTLLSNSPSAAPTLKHRIKGVISGLPRGLARPLAAHLLR
jgi:hypothetical protein